MALLDAVNAHGVKCSGFVQMDDDVVKRLSHIDSKSRGWGAKFMVPKEP